MQKADSVVFETLIERVGAGERLSGDEVRALATTPDILSLGMLADVWRRHRHGSRATFLRVADCPVDSPLTPSIPEKAREVRITGSPARLTDGLRAVEAVKAMGDRTISAFTWSDIDRMAAGESVANVLTLLRSAGLDSLAVLPLDEGATDVAMVIDRLSSAGFTGIRLSIDRAPAEARTNLLLRAAELQDRFGCIQALNPLPMTLAAFRPTTGYDDVKMVAIARLAAPNIPTIQVDWRRYGPKLAQVALTFGADDIDGVSASDEAPEGRRRAPLEEITRNIEAAGFEAIERTGRFTVPA
jgi:aminodeoxyfutalosine synthase